ncbi:DDE-domain-containing protein [Penicillium viridicatum]|nr:DDE-domain-containing protein [Penicillium viridicatum]
MFKIQSKNYISAGKAGGSKDNKIIPPRLLLQLSEVNDLAQLSKETTNGLQPFENFYPASGYLERERTSGSLTIDEIGLCWLKEIFEPYSTRYTTGAKQLLILDGHSSHQNAEFNDFCAENAIICLCMSPHTSYLLQPLDVGVSGPLNRAYSKLVENMIKARNNHIDKWDFLHLYLSACDEPFNQDRVLEKITFQLRTPTPPLLTEGSISSAFQTPQNSRQIDRKVQRLQRSLQKKRTLSSSPVSHIQHLEKAAQMAINTNLLQQEIKVPRAENERKIKKKARRRTALYRKVVTTFSSLIRSLMSRLMSLHLCLANALYHAAVAVGLLDIL